MFLKPDFSPPQRCARLCRSGLRAALAALTAALLAGCSLLPAGKGEASAEKRIPAPAAAPAQGAAAKLPPAPPPVTPVTLTVPAANDALTSMLSYAERVRQMSVAELGQEAARLGADQSGPTNQLQLALVLSQLRQLPDLMRAQELLARVLGNSDAAAQPLHPLARLLAARYAEQRRVEEQLEKQTQQARELQRRLDQTNERLEALKAIERSLTSRPAASAPTPGNRNHPPAP
jgi:hypothetical protein